MGAQQTIQVPRGALQSTLPYSSTSSVFYHRRLQPFAADPIAALRIVKIDPADRSTTLYFKNRIQPIAARPFASWRVVRLFPEPYNTVMGSTSSCFSDMLRIRYIKIGTRINGYTSYSYPWLNVIFRISSAFDSVSSYMYNVLNVISRVKSSFAASSTCELKLLDIHRLLYCIYSVVSNLSIEYLHRIVQVSCKDIKGYSQYNNPYIFLMREGKLIIRILSWLLTLKNMKCGQIVILEDPYI